MHHVRYASVLLILIILGLIDTRAIKTATATVEQQDFGRFYFSVDNALHGSSLYIYDARDRRPNWNPPIFHVLIHPLWMLGSITRAYYGWLILELLTFGAALGLLWRYFALCLEARLWSIVAVLASAPFIAALNGQVGLILLLPITLAWLAEKRGNTRVAAAWIGGLIFLKPFLIPLSFWFVARREWRAIGVLVGTIGALLAAGIGVYGVRDTSLWLAQLRTQPVTWAGFFENGSIAAVVAPTTNPLDSRSWIFAVLGITAATFWQVWQQREHNGVDRSWTLLLTCSLLVSPIAIIYYWWILVPPLGSVLRTSASNGALAWSVIGWFWPVRLVVEKPQLGRMYPLALGMIWLCVLFSRLNSDAYKSDAHL